MGHHVEVLVCCSTQLVQPIDHGAPVYTPWLLEGSHFGFVSDDMWGVHYCHSHCYGAGCLSASLVDCVSWVILSF